MRTNLRRIQYLHGQRDLCCVEWTWRIGNLAEPGFTSSLKSSKLKKKEKEEFLSADFYRTKHAQEPDRTIGTRQNFGPIREEQSDRILSDYRIFYR